MTERATTTTPKPKPAPEIVDAAAQAVDRAKTELDWAGVKMTLPAEIEDVDPDVIEAFEQGKAVSALRALFGSDEYDRGRAEYARQHGHRPTMRDLEPLADAVAAHFGFESGPE